MILWNMRCWGSDLLKFKNANTENRTMRYFWKAIELSFLLNKQIEGMYFLLTTVRNFFGFSWWQYLDKSWHRLLFPKLYWEFLSLISYFMKHLLKKKKEMKNFVGIFDTFFNINITSREIILLLLFINT